MQKIKNYGLWVSLFSLIGLIFKDYLPANYENIVTVILGILVALGIVSDPQTGRWYKDE